MSAVYETAVNNAYSCFEISKKIDILVHFLVNYKHLDEILNISMKISQYTLLPSMQALFTALFIGRYLPMKSAVKKSPL